jgi:hypothetical protein
MRSKIRTYFATLLQVVDLGVLDCESRALSCRLKHKVLESILGACYEDVSRLGVMDAGVPTEKEVGGLRSDNS